MKPPYKYIILTLLVVVIIATGFFRDYVFRYINFNLQYCSDGNYQFPDSLSMFKSFSYSKLSYLKWMLTLLFTFWYFLMAAGCIKLLFDENKYVRWSAIVYLTIIALSALLYFVFSLFHRPETGYRFSRILMGFLQSPFILMILVLAFKVTSSSKEDEKTDMF